MLRAVLLGTIFWSTYLYADDSSLVIPDLKELRPMNGINPAHFDKFWEKWPLVTVRYRADNGEQRFIYANKLAYQAMQDGLMEYPDGAVFGKVAFIAKEDPHFPNSFEPTSYIRMQLMVKNKKKFQDMDGWSYWLHVNGSEAKSAEDHSNALACHACHTLVKDLDFVFATPSFMGKNAARFTQKGHGFKSRFKTRNKKELHEFEKKILALLPQKPKKIKSLRMRLFAGSLHESVGPLASFSEKDTPYLLVDPIEKRFITAQALNPTKDCKRRAAIFMAQKKLKNKNGKKRAVRLVRHGIVCDGKNKWIESKELPADMQI